jgi:hypothetical protein
LDLSGIGDGVIVSTVCSRFRRFIATALVHFLSFLTTAACSVLSKLHDRLSILSPLDLRGRKLIYIMHRNFYIHIMYNVWNQFSIIAVDRWKRIAKYTHREYWRKLTFICVQTGGRTKAKTTAKATKKEAAEPKG